MKAVLFDLDGTIFDTWKLYIESYLLTLHKKFQKRISMRELIELRPISEFRILQNAVGDEWKEYYQDFLLHYRALHETHFGGIYEGIPELLSELEKTNLLLGVISGKSQGAYEIHKEFCNLKTYPVEVLDDHVVEPKPNPEGLLIALEKLQVSPGDAIYVGDSTMDFEAARSAGTDFLGAGWSKNEKEKKDFLEKCPGAKLLEHPKQVWDYIQNFE